MKRMVTRSRALNRYDWRRRFSIWRMRWLERRWIGGLATHDDPKGIGLEGDLADGHWEYREVRRA